MRRLTVAAALLALAAPLAAQDAAPESPQQELRFFGTSDTLFELNQTTEGEPGPNAGEYQKLRELLSLNLAWSAFTVGVQGQGLYYSDRERVDPSDFDRVYDDLTLRKYFLQYVKEKVSFRLGTFYTSLGRGLTLYVQKNDQLGFDEPVNGGTGTVSLGPVEVTALGGRVSDPLLEARHGHHVEDYVYAGHALVELPRELYLGGSYVNAELDGGNPTYGDDEVKTWAVEGGGYGIAGFLDAHAEWAEVDKVEQGRSKQGYGGYLSLSSTFGPITLLGEVKDYWAFAYRYNNPPTAGQNEEAYEHNDVKGGRLKVGADIAATGTLLWASYGDFNTHKRPESLGGEGGDAQSEWYLGVQETYRRLYLEASYFDRDSPDRGFQEQHTLADLHLRVADSGDAAVGFDGRTEKTDYYRLARNRSHLTFSWASLGSVGVRYSWTDRSSYPSEQFWGGELQYFPIQSITLSLFYGDDPGGLVCSGGQCREEPPFEGLRAQVEWRF
jgi:hypothetical protein